MTIRSVVVVAALALASACSRGEDQATDTAARDTTSAAVGRLRASGDSARRAPLAVTARGVGPLRVGMNLGEASTALGVALHLPNGTDTGGCAILPWPGGPAGVRMMAEAGRIVRVDVDSNTIATAEGARVGDTEERIQSLYPGRVTVTPHKYTDGHYLTVTPASPADSAFRIVFETLRGRVTTFRAGRRPQVEYIEGCA